MSEQKKEVKDFHDRKDEGKGVVFDPETETLFKQQQELGRIMDEFKKKELFLEKHKVIINNDDAYFLYRLPLTEEQRKEVYENLISEEE